MPRERMPAGYIESTTISAEAAYEDLLRDYGKTVAKYKNLTDFEAAAIIGRLAGMIIALCDANNRKAVRHMMLVNMDHATAQYKQTIIAPDYKG